jgi:hypothetical protein
VWSCFAQLKTEDEKLKTINSALRCPQSSHRIFLLAADNLDYPGDIFNNKIIIHGKFVGLTP